MKSNKNFLIPVATALAAVTGTGQAIEVKQTGVEDIKNDSTVSQTLKKVLGADDRLATYSKGNELHGLVLRKNTEGIVLAEHYSHRSHASHASHSSHYSSR